MGFGTCCRASASGEPLIVSTLEFLSQGGRLIDTAQMYENHRDVATAIARSGIPRSELWITSKVRTIDTSLTRASTIAEVDKVLAELGLEQLDLLLLHHAKGNGAKERAAQWQALLEVAKVGKARHVGVSNYDLAQLKALQACYRLCPRLPRARAQTHGHARTLLLAGHHRRASRRQSARVPPMGRRVDARDRAVVSA